MASQFASGEKVVADERAVDRARKASSTASRRQEAAELAVADAERALREQIELSRAEWAATSAREAADATQDAQHALVDLRASLWRRAAAEGLLQWLDPQSGGLEHTRRARLGLGTVSGTEKWSANGDALSWHALLAELEANLTPEGDGAPALIPIAAA
jgi:hypothetical protein